MVYSYGVEHFSGNCLELHANTVQNNLKTNKMLHEIQHDKKSLGIKITVTFLHMLWFGDEDSGLTLYQLWKFCFKDYCMIIKNNSFDCST